MFGLEVVNTFIRFINMVMCVNDSDIGGTGDDDNISINLTFVFVINTS